MNTHLKINTHTRTKFKNRYDTLLLSFSELINIDRKIYIRVGSRGRVQGVRTPHPSPSEISCGFLIQLVFCKKKDYVVYWC